MFCVPCSSSIFICIQGDSKNAAAPALSGIIGRKSGEGTNFPYSKAMKNAGFVWSDKHIFMYLLNPGKYIPGNKMSFAGIAEEQDRADVIAYLLDN